MVSFTSMDGFTRSLLPRNSTPATFMPMVESPGETGVARHAGAIRGGQHRNVLELVLAFPFGAVFADEIMQFRRAHFLLKFRLA